MLCLVLVILGHHAATAAEASLEFAVKAAFIPKFVPFVEWPNGAFYGADGAVRLCVAGQDPFGDLLDRVADHQTIAGHPVEVRRLPTISRDSGCQVLFVGGSSNQPVAAMLTAVRGTPVLTLTDNSHDPQTRGIINFIISDGRVRFEIDDTAAAQNQLSISSKLLSLAVRVLGGR